MGATILGEAAEAVNELPMPPLAFGAVALVALLGLLVVTLSFRNVGNRH